MNIIQILLIAVSLAMDAFAVSICKGLKMKRIDYKYTVTLAAFFGGAQAIMPLIGYFIGNIFEKYITKFDHWISFAILVFIGVKMILDAVKDKEEDTGEILYDYKDMFILAIATSIDALAVGVTFSFEENSIVIPVIIIGIVTFLISFIGVKIGNKFGAKYNKKAEIFGGVMLCLIGIKILLEGLNIIT
ncbi:MAG: manganese efflux pump MntP family protein, partial [Acutalibacteraceae bacterium]